jgi:hypothetical protein
MSERDACITHVTSSFERAAEYVQATFEVSGNWTSRGMGLVFLNARLF